MICSLGTPAKKKSLLQSLFPPRKQRPPEKGGKLRRGRRATHTSLFGVTRRRRYQSYAFSGFEIFALKKTKKAREASYKSVFWADGNL